jgi:hypothetical protein
MTKTNATSNSTGITFLIGETDSDALDNIIEKPYLVIEHQVLQTFLPTLLGREIASLLHVFPM